MEWTIDYRYLCADKETLQIDLYEDKQEAFEATADPTDDPEDWIGDRRRVLFADGLPVAVFQSGADEIAAELVDTLRAIERLDTGHNRPFHDKQKH